MPRPDRLVELFAHEQQADARVRLTEYAVLMEALALARAWPNDPRLANLRRLAEQREEAQQAHLAITRAFAEQAPHLPVEQTSREDGFDA